MKLSVLMITYNHEKYIAQALDSVLMQEVNFKYEIVIGEDCSSDGTRDKLLEYYSKYPDKIRPLLRKKNLGMIKNFVETFKVCQGEYIALLEGDDYWTSPNKLQKQVDFLDTHPECSICFHNVDVINDDTPRKRYAFHHITLFKKIFTLKDVVSRHFIPTCSTVFRNGLFNDFPDWYFSMPMGDWPLHVLNAEHGNLGYINELLATYRVHKGGLWSQTKKIDIEINTIRAAKTIDQYLNFKFKRNIDILISRRHYEIAKILSLERDFGGAIYHARRSLKMAPLHNIIEKSESVKIIISAAFHRLIDR